MQALKELEIKMSIKKQSVFVILNRTNAVDFQWENADISRSRGVCHVIYIFFGAPLGKI